MKTDHLRHRPRGAIAEVAVDGISDHGAQLIQTVTLGYDGMPEGRGHVASIGGVFLDLKDDFAHLGTHSPARQARQCRPCLA
jgi:hypothetical protein